MSTDLWGNQINLRCCYHVYHDESEPKPNKGWFLIGLLFVPAEELSRIERVLNWHREREKYFGEVHFSELPGKFCGEWGGKARLSKRWLQAYQDGLFSIAKFSCLAINRNSVRYDRSRFKHDFHAYNRFTAMAIKAGVAWHLSRCGYSEIDLALISDGKDRRSNPDKALIDNFVDYVPERVELDNWLTREIQGKDYPSIGMMKVQTPASKDSDLLQLTDLLLGAFQCALVSSSKKLTKMTLGLMVADWCEDICRKPWEQKYKMHRKFNVWGFPDDNGRPFKLIRLRIRDLEDAMQPRLVFE